MQLRKSFLQVTGLRMRTEVKVAHATSVSHARSAVGPENFIHHGFRYTRRPFESSRRTHSIHKRVHSIHSLPASQAQQSGHSIHQHNSELNKFWHFFICVFTNVLTSFRMVFLRVFYSLMWSLQSHSPLTSFSWTTWPFHSPKYLLNWKLWRYS